MPARFSFGSFLSAMVLAGAFLVPVDTWASNFFGPSEIYVTEDDLFHYLKDRLNPEVYESALSKPDAMKNSLVNLFVIRKGALMAKQRELIGDSEIRYYREDGADRVALKYFINAETDELFANTNWSALAEEQYIVDSEKYFAPEDVWVEHILISSEGRTFNNLVDRCAEVASLIGEGKPFHELAKQYSDDPSAERNGGDLGYIRRGQTVPQFEEAAFSMSEPGQISDPILTRFGVHFIRFRDKRSLQAVAFDQAKPSIIEDLKKTRGSNFKAEILAPFRLEGRELLIDIDEEQLARRMFQRLTEQ